MAEMFSNAADYENMMGRWSARLAVPFLDFVGIRDGDSVLDVGCGTGSLVAVVADRTRRSAITGIDPVASFIEYARSRFADPRVRFERGSAFELPYSDEAFDACLSLLVLMLIPTPEKAASEMFRVTRRGGVAAACTWAANEGLSRPLWEEAIKLDAQAPVERPLHCNRQAQLAALWQATGFIAIEETALEFHATFGCFDDYWLPYLKGAGPPGQYVSGLNPERRDALRDALRRRLVADQPDGPFTVSTRAWAVRGAVPS